MKKLVSLLLALVMLFTLVACNAQPVETKPNTTEGNKQPTETQPKETEPPEPVKITMFPMNANVMSGVVGGWLGEYLASQGIILEIMAYSDDKLNAIIAGGDLPDIVYLSATQDHKTLSESGLFLDLEQHLDKLPNISSNESYMAAVDYMKEYVTDGALTMLPQNVGPAGQGVTTTAAVKMNWDVYQKIGCPEFSNLDELIPILKKMKEAYPVDANGKETYAMHMYSNMDSANFYNILSTFTLWGYNINEMQYGIEGNNVDGTWDWMFEDDSAYKASMKFFNTMYKEDLLDPNSINADLATQNALIESGNAIATFRGLPGYEQHGYYPAYYKDYRLTVSKLGFPFGSGAYTAVSAKTEKLDTVLKFLNLSADPEAVRILLNGPQGELWDLEGDKLVLTEKGKDIWLNGKEVYIGEEKYAPFNSPWLLHPNYTHPVDGETVNVPSSKTYMLLTVDNDGQKQWAEHYGYSDIRSMLKDKNQEVATFDELVAKFAENPDDDQNLIIAAANEIIVNASWKMVYAETEAEFEKLWDDMVKELDDLGFKDVYNWRVKTLTEAKKTRDSLIG